MSEEDDVEPLSDLADRVPEEDDDPAGNPFEEMAPKATVDDDAANGDRPSRADGDDPGERSGDGADPDAPLGDLAARVDERRKERERSGGDELFTEKEVGEIDRESLWEQVTSDEPTETVEDAAEDVREISKRAYCQGCEYFSAPPNMHCSHEGTEIREVVDLEHFLVVNCPVVREDARLGKMGSGTD